MACSRAKFIVWIRRNEKWDVWRKEEIGHACEILLENIKGRDKEGDLGMERVKPSSYKPGQTLVTLEGSGSQNLRQSAYKGDKVVSRMQRQLVPPPPKVYTWYSCLLEAELTLGP
jgi:hypothetical protein